MSPYRSDGRPPILGVRPPAMIADFEAQCVLIEEGSWRFRSHLVRPIFVSSDLPASIRSTPTASNRKPKAFARTAVPPNGSSKKSSVDAIKTPSDDCYRDASHLGKICR